MMRIPLNIFVVGLTALLLFSGCGYYTGNTLELPAYEKNELVIAHKAYTLSYNEETEQAHWVAWELNTAELNGAVKRSNKFRPDPNVTTGSATDEDYYKSGFDRGHLAPAADMAWDKEVMDESFYYSNMSPQAASFNRGIWKRLESRTRQWAEKYQQVFVVTGPLYLQETKTIGPNRVAVPSHYYKGILVLNNDIQQAVGFIMPNKKSGNDIYHYAVSIDSIEKASGLDLYPAIRNKYEKTIEASYDLSYWR
ncbi:MAG: DNA/RNA non-specific endonuclease [Salinivirgaceae bacterium]